MVVIIVITVAINETAEAININAGGINEMAEIINTKAVVVIYFAV